jgi:N-methylhydantoinase A
VWLDGAARRVPLYRRQDFLAGQTFTGPAVITQDDCTTCVPPGFAASVDAYGNLRIKRA